ncbi:MAG: pilin [Candidatus Moranbacteria bacterium]|nr:pilin [Candidatus Moranbacteria bacterium]
MNKIKQALYAATATALTATPFLAGAQSTGGPVSTGFDQTATGAQGLTGTPIFDLISTFMNWLLGLVGVLAVIAFVISGILYLTAAGNEEQIEKAKSTMMYAIIGLVVALVGLVIVNAVSGLTNAGVNTGF